MGLGNTILKFTYDSNRGGLENNEEDFSKNIGKVIDVKRLFGPSKLISCMFSHVNGNTLLVQDYKRKQVRCLLLLSEYKCMMTEARGIAKAEKQSYGSDDVLTHESKTPAITMVYLNLTFRRHKKLTRNNGETSEELKVIIISRGRSTGEANGLKADSLHPKVLKEVAADKIESTIAQISFFSGDDTLSEFRFLVPFITHLGNISQHFTYKKYFEVPNIMAAILQTARSHKSNYTNKQLICFNETVPCLPSPQSVLVCWVYSTEQSTTEILALTVDGRRINETAAKSNCPSEIGLMAEKKKSKKKLQAQSKVSSLEADSALLEIQQRERASTLIRSQAFDEPGLKNEDEPYVGRKSSSSASIFKSNATFHKQFTDIPENENVIDSFKCALHKEVPYHGKMYVSDNYICFYSSILKETKLVVPVTEVILLKKQNTALLVPNALCIKTTEGDKHLFASLRSRDMTLKVLKTVCAHLENGSSCNSPQVSPLENSYSADSQKSLQLNHSSLEQKSQDLDDVDATDCRQDSPESTPSTDADHTTRNGTVLCKENKEQEGQLDEGTSCYNGASWFGKVTQKVKSFAAFHESTTINTLIIIYVLLVLLLLISSGYIGFRIVAIEEQLMSMGAWPDLHAHSQYKKT
ncbi:GRAM domain-containing protein 2B [Heptranchias perlo]|uniref:GRAM domain-containing protein 2B n=1 Tax=Heptranchias perlo TaxID=212740 RepID=UPI00355A3DEA